MNYFVDGLFGQYRFAEDMSNILYKGLPDWSFLLGQVVFILFSIHVSRNILRWDKKRLSLKGQTNKELYRELWEKGSAGKSQVIMTIIAIGYLLFTSASKVYTSYQMYHQFSQPVQEVVDGKLSDFSIESGGSFSPYANVDAIFEGQDGKSYTVHFVNMNKRMANKIAEGSSYDAELHLGKDGKILYSNDFLASK